MCRKKRAEKPLVLILLCFCTAPLAGADRPDVLMIAVDDLRPMLGCYGDARMRTPNIDRLARQGVVFERAYCQYAKCGTSRLSLLTGLRPGAIGVFSNRNKDVIDFRQRRPDAVSLPAWLRQHGYHTQSFGKIYHDGWDNPEDWSVPSMPGRDNEMLEVVDDSDLRKPTIIAERIACPVMQSPDVPDDHLFAGRMTTQVIRTMRQRRDKPLFLAVGYRRPHLPFVAPKRYFDKYQPDDSWLAKHPLPSLKAPLLAWFNSDGYVGTAKRAGLTMPSPPTRQQAVAWNGYELRSYLGVPNQGEIPRSLQLQLLQAYAACISYVDAQIGRLLDELERTGQLQQTVIVFWSDHGWHLGEQSAWGKMTNYEVATRVPLIVAGPGIPNGHTSTIVELVDLFPTLCELVDIPRAKHLQGDALIAALNDPARHTPSTALSQYARFGGKYMGRALRTDQYRLVIWTEQASRKVLARELYDAQADPHENKNLADDPSLARKMERLEKQLMELTR